MISADHELLFRRDGIITEVAADRDAIRAAQALRHQVFCRERNLFMEDPTNPIDQDEFDHHAKHVLVRHAATGEVIATSRVVSAARSGGDLPMLRYCCPSLFEGHPMQTIGEISRFAISKEARGVQASGPLIRLGLLRGILSASHSIGLTHWCALMEPSLMRLMQLTGVRFEPIGPMVEAYGRRQPCVARIDVTVAAGRMSHPHFYKAVAGRSFAQAA